MENQPQPDFHPALNSSSVLKGDDKRGSIAVISLEESKSVDILDRCEPSLSHRAAARRYQILLLVSGFLMIFQVNGINSIFGVFQEFYTSENTNIEHAQGQEALVSLVGTLGYGITYAGSIFVSPLVMSTSSVRTITISGSIVMSAGLLLASFSTKLWHLYLTQALLFGVGAALLYFPFISLAPRFFDRHRGFAMGIILSGNGVGGLVLAPTVQVMILRVGIRWTLRIMALWTIGLMLPVACILKQVPDFAAGKFGVSGYVRTILRLSQKSLFYAQAIGTCLQAAGAIIPLIYLSTYSTSVLGYSSSTASLLIALNSAVNSFARVVLGCVADRVGRQNMLFTGVLLSAATVFGLWFDSSPSRFTVFVVLYGIFSGGYNALLPTSIADIYGVRDYDTVTGLIYVLRGIGTIAGPPIAGAILADNQVRDGDSGLGRLMQRYDKLIIFAGSLLFGASVCVGYVRLRDAKEKGNWKWKA